MALRIVGFSGNLARPSRTRTLVQAVLDTASARGLGQTAIFDLIDAGATFGQTSERAKAHPEVEAILDAIQKADALVVGTAVYKGAYTGLFKHLFDLFDMTALARKPVIVTATGAAPHHASVIDYHLRPLFLFFDCSVATRGLYALQPDFESPERLVPAFQARIDRTVDELAQMLQPARSAS
ncbi:NAD(P)H-dependent oxidoreductase [Variovorax sp. Sphag1AA]|uniref:NAD(P)H-dependent oxidoreductase n=1 Tax=Variovorax sp. Sphag1AA TaxID=2587027 RepID=UPI00161AB403|nr:NAD(P)H-dependent oxidoreductase [Variovorax sp. Sphag1AA]MBB3181840.1 FMN reductase [Variovorax sp. Sphag1AA]